MNGFRRPRNELRRTRSPAPRYGRAGEQSLRPETTLKVLEDTYHYRYDGLAERLAGISLRRLSVLMDEAFNIALMLDESFLD